MIESGAQVGPAHWIGLISRRGAETALARTVRSLRQDPSRAEDNPLAVVAFHHDDQGNRLPARIAAVELLNLLRPIVAIARYVAFSLHAVESQPGAREFVEEAGPRERASFTSEVRRFYPFFPAVAAIARTEVEFEGHPIPAGRRVLLDLWGTNRGPDHQDPDRFDPSRFLELPGPFDLIPQGGGDVVTGHRCPGERLTASVMAAALDVLVNELTFTIQPGTISFRRIPTAPNGGLVLASVHPRHA